ncbi:hypothetical protein DOY81_013618, partial [Sarcophaga bullata]
QESRASGQLSSLEEEVTTNITFSHWLKSSKCTKMCENIFMYINITYKRIY